MIKIICVGKIKEPYLRDGILEYQKRLSKYTKMDIIEVEDDGLVDEKKALLNERDRILKNIKSEDYVIALDIEGVMYNSITFSSKIDKLLSNIRGDITFVIGGSYGLHDDIKNKADFKLSFSKMTFPHQLFRVMILEQIYRAFKINHNETYHK